jgi:nicotinate dehydrogenase subunit B
MWFSQPRRKGRAARSEGNRPMSPLASKLSRRQFSTGAGVLVASFLLGRKQAFGQAADAPAPLSFSKNPNLAGWIRLNEAGIFTVFTGKAELGQGIYTALAQIAAEELDVAINAIQVIGPDTTRGPDEGYTYGSQSIEQSGAAIRAASARARALLVEAAARKLGVAPDALTVADGVMSAVNGTRTTYGEIVAANHDLLEGSAVGPRKPKHHSNYKLVGKSADPVDLRQKVTGQAYFLQDLRLPGMLFGRVVRPGAIGASLASVEIAATRAMSGVVSVVRNGSFLGVVTEREEQAIKARQSLAAAAVWSHEGPRLPAPARLKEALKNFAKEDKLVIESAGTEAVLVASILEGELQPTLFVARLRRTVLRGCLVRRRPHEGVVSYPGHFSAAGGPCYRTEASGLCRRRDSRAGIRLLWTQWRRRCRVRCSSARTQCGRTAGQIAVDA